MDYILGTLVTSNFEMVRRIVDIEVPIKSRKREHQKKMEYCEQYLKYFYQSHIGNDHDPAHDIAHGIHGDSDITRSTTTYCTQCLVTLQVLKEIRSDILEDKESSRLSIDECMNNLKTYLGHEMR